MTLFRWQRLISLASSGLFGALMLHSAAHSDVHVVQEGDDLQAVLNAAQSGDTIQLE